MTPTEIFLFILLIKIYLFLQNFFTSVCTRVVKDIPISLKEVSVYVSCLKNYTLSQYGSGFVLDIRQDKNNGSLELNGQIWFLNECLKLKLCYSDMVDTMLHCAQLE